jgi:hypothetical protein
MGATGATGATGGAIAYGQIYLQNGNIPFTVTGLGNTPYTGFDTAGASLGTTLSPADGTITVNTGGTWLVSYYLNFSSLTNAFRTFVSVNGNLVSPNSNVGSAAISNPGSLFITSLNATFILPSLNAGDVIGIFIVSLFAPTELNVDYASLTVARLN